MNEFSESELPEDEILDLAKLAEALNDLILEFSAEDEDPDVDDIEEEEYASDVKEEVRKYQREFGKYIDVLRNELSSRGYDVQKPDNGKYPGLEEKRPETDMETVQSPFERGHKWGCGCPGCTSFRESFIANSLDSSGIKDRAIPGQESSSMTREENHREDKSEYPCGGKLRGMFKNNFLKYSLEGTAIKPGLMKYMAI